MSKKDILAWFTNNGEALDTSRILFVLILGLAMAAIIFITYRITYTGVSYNARFNITNVIVLLVAAVIMLMISSNITISLGMVGALSIVRYRTAVKDPHDTVYIFWSIVEGLCVGAQIYKLAVISTIFIAVILVAASFYTNTFSKYLIIIRGNVQIQPNDIEKIIGQRYRKFKIRNISLSELSCEMICEVTSKKENDCELIDEIKRVENVTSVNWLLESRENVG